MSAATMALPPVAVPFGPLLTTTPTPSPLPLMRSPLSSPPLPTASPMASPTTTARRTHTPKVAVRVGATTAMSNSFATTSAGAASTDFESSAGDEFLSDADSASAASQAPSQPQVQSAQSHQSQRHSVSPSPVSHASVSDADVDADGARSPSYYSHASSASPALVATDPDVQLPPCRHCDGTGVAKEEGRPNEAVQWLFSPLPAEVLVALYRQAPESVPGDLTGLRYLIRNNTTRRIAECQALLETLMSPNTGAAAGASQPSTPASAPTATASSTAGDVKPAAASASAPASSSIALAAQNAVAQATVAAQLNGAGLLPSELSRALSLSGLPPLLMQRANSGFGAMLDSNDLSGTPLLGAGLPSRSSSFSTALLGGLPGLPGLAGLPPGLLPMAATNAALAAAVSGSYLSMPSASTIADAAAAMNALARNASLSRGALATAALQRLQSSSSSTAAASATSTSRSSQHHRHHHSSSSSHSRSARPGTTGAAGKPAPPNATSAVPTGGSGVGQKRGRDHRSSHSHRSDRKTSDKKDGSTPKAAASAAPVAATASATVKPEPADAAATATATGETPRNKRRRVAESAAATDEVDSDAETDDGASAASGSDADAARPAGAKRGGGRRGGGDAAKPERLPKVVPVLAARGLVSGVKNSKASPPYYELWVQVPYDYVLKNGKATTVEERNRPVEVPIRILQLNHTPRSFADLLMPAQDVGKLTGIRSGNVSKDIIKKILGPNAHPNPHVPAPTPSDAATANDANGLPLLQHTPYATGTGGTSKFGSTLIAPTPSNSSHCESQPQCCIRLDKVMDFLKKRKKPAKVDEVLRAGLKAFPFGATAPPLAVPALPAAPPAAPTATAMPTPTSSTSAASVAPAITSAATAAAASIAASAPALPLASGATTLTTGLSLSAPLVVPTFPVGALAAAATPTLAPVDTPMRSMSLLAGTPINIATPIIPAP